MNSQVSMKQQISIIAQMAPQRKLSGPKQLTRDGFNTSSIIYNHQGIETNKLHLFRWNNKARIKFLILLSFSSKTKKKKLKHNGRHPSTQMFTKFWKRYYGTYIVICYTKIFSKLSCISLITPQITTRYQLLIIKPKQ